VAPSVGAICCQREVHFQLLRAGRAEGHRLDTVAEYLGAKIEQRPVAPRHAPAHHVSQG
jgi:hypothetical protein